VGPVWEDADGEEIVNETFTRLEKAFHERTNWGLLLKVSSPAVPGHASIAAIRSWNKASVQAGTCVNSEWE